MMTKSASFQLLVEKLLEAGAALIEMDVEFGIGLAEIVDGADRRRAFVVHQIGERPGAQFLVASHFVSHARQFADKPAQKMRIAMIPVADPGMREETKLQVSYSCRSNSRGDH